MRPSHSESGKSRKPPLITKSSAVSRSGQEQGRQLAAGCCWHPAVCLRASAFIQPADASRDISGEPRQQCDFLATGWGEWRERGKGGGTDRQASRFSSFSARRLTSPCTSLPTAMVVVSKGGDGSDGNGVAAAAAVSDEAQESNADSQDRGAESNAGGRCVAQRCL